MNPNVIKLKTPCKTVVNVTWVTHTSVLTRYLCNKKKCLDF